ncbi:MULTISPECIES: helix-turn-helix domain-containing protein [unclassified Desulfovibrio]|uniref:helix-turn-helix domain-containing protein n=1 Tax=unclassified Desulfovibrio TaxID=2593640 RepID=UPI000F5F6B54|nr:MULTISPECIES: helix-turn-helix domain-containing protein [unclassified Desulfovibrio]RRD71220.1 XRE family transcriptional regulator [Desulfovibrio sp. OH1209_COT-279]RRD87508.1 XRE family transcriptional regulator [Desulfovibrio sp. OH1186_COT-070]
MNADVKVFPGNGGHTEINLSIPSNKADAVLEALSGILPLAGLRLRRVNEDGEKIYSVKEVFPDANPAMALRGFRGKMEWTQQELASRLGTTQNSISAMESGKRPISRAMAMRLGEVFDIAYKVFL